MRYFLRLIILMTFISCENFQGQDKEAFLFNEFHKTVPHQFINCYKIQEAYFCYDKQKNLSILDKNFVVDEALSKKIKANFKIGLIRQNRDTIFASERLSVYSVRQRYLDENFEWQISNEKVEFPFYDDENFSVTDCCFGEFGGSVFFRNKSNEKVYSCESTCPVALNKLNGEYYLTTALAHFSGSSEILKIADPEKLFELLGDSLQHECHWWSKPDPGSGKYKSEESELGTEIVFDTLGLIILTAFERGQELYFLSTDLKKMFINKLNRNILTTIETLTAISFYSFQGNPTITPNGFIYFFKTDDQKGFIELDKNSINTYFLKKSKNFPISKKVQEKIKQTIYPK